MITPARALRGLSTPIEDHLTTGDPVGRRCFSRQYSRHLGHRASPHAPRRRFRPRWRQLATGALQSRLGSSKMVEPGPHASRHCQIRPRRDRVLSALLDSSDDAIVSTDVSGAIRIWSRGAERIFGYSADEMIGRSLSILMPGGTGASPRCWNVSGAVSGSTGSRLFVSPRMADWFTFDPGYRGTRSAGRGGGCGGHRAGYYGAEAQRGAAPDHGRPLARHHPLRCRRHRRH